MLTLPSLRHLSRCRGNEGIYGSKLKVVIAGNAPRPPGGVGPSFPAADPGRSQGRGRGMQTDMRGRGRQGRYTHEHVAHTNPPPPLSGAPPIRGSHVMLTFAWRLRLTIYEVGECALWNAEMHHGSVQATLSLCNSSHHRLHRRQSVLQLLGQELAELLLCRGQQRINKMTKSCQRSATSQHGLA